MASKRDFKKAVHRACDSIIDECIFAQQMFGGDDEKWDQIVVRTALMNQKAMQQVAAQFGKKAKEFASRRDYRKARRQFARNVIAAAEAYMRDEVAAIADDMNALMPKKA